MNNKWVKEKDGYVLVSTLFFLVLSGIFAQSMIQISSNYVIQLRQIGMGYEARAALNMSETLLVEEIEKKAQPIKGTISTSVGQVKITGRKQADQILSQLTLIKENGTTFKKEVSTPLAEKTEE